MALVGTWKDSDEPGAVVAYEWPEAWVRTAHPIDKRGLETLHLYKFSIDQRLALGAPAFGAAELGADPPDFRVGTDQGVIGLDCSAFTVQERRHAHALFVALRRCLVDAGPNSYLHLAGHLIHLWFPEPERLAKPFVRGDDVAITELVDALREYEPTPENLRVAGAEAPQQMPDLGTATTTAGATFYAALLMGSVPDSAFFAYMGFEIALTYTTAHRRSSVWAEAERLVAAHDQPGIDWLLLSAGAPNRDGNTFPSEEVLARLLIDHPQELPAPKHLQGVTLHLWSTGEAFALLPTVERIFGPIYASSVPSHRPIYVPVVSEERDAASE
jgi:hypothetical protein